MTREQFLEQLRQALSGMKAEELEGVISYYDEMLDDRMEAGMTEEAAVNAMEPVQVIAARVLSEADVEAAAPGEGAAKESKEQEIRRPAGDIRRLCVTAENKRIVFRSEETEEILLRYSIEENTIFELHEDNGTLTLSVPGAVLTGHKGDGYFEADGRYIYAPDGWLVRGDVLYLPGDTIERLFGIEVSVSAARLELSTDKLAVISGGANYYELNYDAELLYWLPQIINAEAKFEPLAGQIGVGNVVMNRLSSPDFPDTIFEVIYDTEHTIQFEPISTGGIFMEPTEQATIAAYLCLEGCSTVGDCLYFVNPDYGSGWFDSSLELVETIGHHNFYK